MRWAGLFCVAALLLATTVQAAHVCGFPLLRSDDRAHLRSANRSGTLCLTCLMAQAAAPSGLFLTSALPPPHLFLVGWRQPHPSLLWGPFRLYIRPPPAC